MKYGIAIGLLAVAALVAQGRAQSGGVSADIASGFSPLEEWKNAVLAADSVGLKRLYSTNPAPEVTLERKESSPDTEIDFWLGLKPRSMKLDVVQSESPQAGSQIVVFQVEVQSWKSGNGRTVYVNEAQAWQQQANQWRLVAVQRTNPAHLKQPLNQDKDIYPAGVDAHAEIREAEARAAKEQKRVLLVFGANWCYDCHVLDLAFQRPDFLPVMARYEVVHVDIGADGKKNGDVAQQFQVPLNKGIPALAVVEGTGKLVISQKNGEFENARAMTPEAVLEFLNKWKLDAR